MTIPEQLNVLEKAHWLINHRMNSALPGYLMIGSRQSAVQLSDLPAEALSELGLLLAKAERVLRDSLKAERVYSGRYGHTQGYSPHFHVIPIYGWVEQLFWRDTRYRSLRRFSGEVGETSTDGAEMTLFVWREFCEREIPPPIEGPSVEETIAALRVALATKKSVV
jgi:diadenosine tetraphosphate (Ap4A) HIT family hydrolase